MKVLQLLKNMYRSSMLGKCGNCISRAYGRSVVFSSLRAGEMDRALGESVVIRKNTDKTKSIYKGKILPFLFSLASKLCCISGREFSILLSFFLLSSAASAFIDASFTRGVIFAVAILPLLPLLFTKMSLAALFCNSFLGRLLGLSCGPTAQKQNKILLILIGTLGIVGGMFVSFPYSVLLPLAPVALLMLLVVKPLTIIYVIMLCLPIFGTSVCIVLSVLLAVSHWLQRFFGTVSKTKIDYIDILLSVYIALCVISSFFSFAIADSLRVALMWVILFSTVFIVIRNVRTRRNLLSVLGFLLVGTVIASCIGLFQYFSGQVDTTWTDTALFEDLNIRIYSTFANPNVFGEFLLLVIPISAGLGIYFRKLKYKIASFGVLLLSLVALALTYSRGCYVGLVVTVVVFLWMYNKKILGLLLVIGTPIGITMLPQNMIDRILSMVNLADSSTSYRLKIYQGSFELLKTYWPSGLGIGETAFNYVYPFFGIQGIVAPHTHSLFLQLMTSFGIAGLIYVLFLLFVYHRNIISFSKKYQKNDRNKLLLIIFGSVLSGFLVQSIFDYTWYNYRVYMLFWLIIALGIATYKILREERVLDD